MECGREDDVKSEVNMHEDSQSHFVEVEKSEYFLKDCEDQRNEQLENDASRGCIYVDSSDDECVDDTRDIFGDDWMGKPGVSTSEDEDPPTDNSAVEPKKKLIRGKPMPSNITVVHGEPIRYKCTICVKTFNSKGHIQYHAYCGQSDKPYKCNLCPKSFPKKTVLDYHVKTHSGERPFTCLTCDKSFLQLDKLKRHQRIHFGNDIECDVCHEKFRDSNSLNVHKRSHSETTLYLFKCCVCSKSFKDKSTLNKHIRGVHSTSKQFFCEHCGKGFNWKYNLVSHLRTHSGIRAYSCNECKRTFKNHSDCYKHRLTHTDEREYKCEVCDSTFKRRDNLLRHFRNIHPEKELSKFKVRTVSKPSTSSATVVKNPESERNPNNCRIPSESSRTPSEPKRIPSHFSKMPTESSRIPFDFGKIANTPNITYIEFNRHLAECGVSKNDAIRIAHNSNIIVNEVRSPGHCGLLSDFNSITTQTERVPSEAVRIPNSTNIVFGEPSRISNKVPTNLNIMFHESIKNPRELVKILNAANIVFSGSRRFPIVPGTPGSNVSDSNRTSVIRSFNPSQSNNPAQQSSVIRHSRNTSSSEDRSLSPVRDCVIKSTKP